MLKLNKRDRDHIAYRLTTGRYRYGITNRRNSHPPPPNLSISTIANTISGNAWREALSSQNEIRKMVNNTENSLIITHELAVSVHHNWSGDHTTKHQHSKIYRVINAKITEGKNETRRKIDIKKW